MYSVCVGNNAPREPRALHVENVENTAITHAGPCGLGYYILLFTALD